MVGGVERFIYAIKNALEKKGHKVELLGSYEGENFVSFFSRWYSKKWYKKTIEKIKEFKPDVVHITHCIRVLSPSVIKASLDSKVPVILNPHDLHYLCPRLGGIYDKNRPKKYKSRHKCFFQDCLGYEERYKDIPRNIWRILKLMLHRKIIRGGKIFFVSNSKFLANAMKKSLGVTPQIIPNGIDIPKEKTNYNKTILFVGQINEEKGLPTIINELNKLEGYERIVLGQGSIKKDLESKYTGVKFLGFQNPEKYYKNASIVVVPSVWMDTFPYVVLEAMSYGTCVIASDIGGISEQVQHMNTGLLFSPGNSKDFQKKIRYLIKKPSEIRRMGANARNFVKKNFNWGDIVKKYEEVYLKAIKNS